MSILTVGSANAIGQTDDHLACAVTEAIEGKLGRPNCGLLITPCAGVVKLQGFVHSFYEKQLTLHSARRVPGVCGVVDELQVEWTKN